MKSDKYYSGKQLNNLLTCFLRLECQAVSQSPFVWASVYIKVTHLSLH